MKYKFFFLITVILAFQACEDCTITELEDPNAFDCPELMTNIGDPCDDNDPDTENDMVDANCNCVGAPVSNCVGVLYASRVTIENNQPTAWYFDSAVKSPGAGLNFNNLEQKTSSWLDPTAPFFSNFSAFDPINNEYAFAYQFDVGTPNPLYLTETDVFNSNFLEQEEYYGAPVFLNGELYAIDVFYDAPTAQYTIKRIDQTTGSTTDLFSDNITVNSPLIKSALSSTADASGNLYFASATNLIVYNVAGNAVTYVDIDPGYDADNQIVYTGLEYKADEDLVLAIRSKLNSPNDKIAELVSISTDGNYTVNTIFDIKNNLGTENDEEIDFNFHSTTFAQCDNTYYISEIKDLGSEPVESFLIEIDLNANALTETVFPDYIYGLAIFEN